MAISLKTAGTWARLVADGTVAIPGSPAAGDRMFLFGSWKTFSVTVATPNGWTPIGNEFADGAVASGNGTGSVKVRAFYRDWVSGDSAPTIDYSANPTEGHWVIQLWQKGASDKWANDPTLLTAAISAADPFSATSSGTATVRDGSVVMCLVGLRDDSTTIARTTTAITDDGSPALTWNGNYVESPATHFNSTTGDDMSGDLGHRFVTTGGSGVNLVVTGDPAAAETGAALWVIQSLAPAVTGTGAADIDAPAVASTGTERMVGTGAVDLDAPAAAASGVERMTGTGGLDLDAPAAAGTGTVTSSGVTGTGALTIAAPGVSGSAVERITGQGAVSLQGPAVAGTGALRLTGTANLSIQAPSVASTGTERITGSGSPSIDAPAVSGSGTEHLSGSGGVDLNAPAVAASGTLRLSGSGNVTLAAPAATGTGTERIAGSAALTISAPFVEGYGTPPDISGDGAITLSAPTTAASGTVTNPGVTGTGAVVIGAPSVSGGALNDLSDDVTGDATISDGPSAVIVASGGLSATAALEPEITATVEIN